MNLMSLGWRELQRHMENMQTPQRKTLGSGIKPRQFLLSEPTIEKSCLPLNLIFVQKCEFAATQFLQNMALQ